MAGRRPRGVWRDGANGEFWFDAADAEHRVEFIEENLTHVKGEWAGRAFVLEAWQKAIVRALFGWKRQDGNRRFKTMFLYVPRKNGKTLLLAAILLVLFFIDREPGAEVFNVASTRKQARICFKLAKAMVQNSPMLKKRVAMFQSAMTFGDASYQVLSSDQGGTQHGENPHAVGFDELHAQKNDDLYEAVTTGDVARRQPVIIFTTTADVVRESVCNDEYEYAVNVRDGLVPDEHYLACIYECPKDQDGNYADWRLESSLRAANPNYGVSVKPEKVLEAVKRAMVDASKENQVKRLHLNIRTEQVSRWLSGEHWRACATEMSVAAFAFSLRTRKCLGGIDIGENLDLGSFALLFPPTPEESAAARMKEAASPKPSEEGEEPGRELPAGLYRAMWRHWVPQATLQDVKNRPHARMYEPWTRNCICLQTGEALKRVTDCPAALHLTPGVTTDLEKVRQDVNALATLYDITEIAVDQHMALHLLTLLEQDGLTVFKHAQSCPAMHPGISELERILVGRRFEHSGDAVATWTFGNIAIYQNGYGEKRFDKSAGRGKKAGARALRKIDPMVALAMPVGRAALMQEAAAPNFAVI